jgi:hypothetical protein
MENLVKALAEGETPKPILAKNQAMEKEITDLRNDKAEWAECAALKRTLSTITEKTVRNILSATGWKCATGAASLT